MTEQNKKETRSPRITQLSWGCMEVEGLGAGRDFKLYPGGGREWDWAETGTHHVPGIQPLDVHELLEHGSRVVVLSRGMQLALQTGPETLKMLRERGVAYYIEETKRAVDLYNRLATSEGSPITLRKRSGPWISTIDWQRVRRSEVCFIRPADLTKAGRRLKVVANIRTRVKINHETTSQS